MRYVLKANMIECDWCQGQHDELKAGDAIGTFHCPHCYGENKVTNDGPYTVKVKKLGEN